MNITDISLGTVSQAADDTVTLCYERIFARPIETVWSAITDPERIADWLGTAELEPRVGGRFSVMVGQNRDIPIKGEVVAWEPPSELSCTWAWPGGVAGVISYSLTPVSSHKTRLVFTHTGLPRSQAAPVLPGWHLYLERLGHALETGVPERDFSVRHAEVRAMYGQRLGLEVDACRT